MIFVHYTIMNTKISPMIRTLSFIGLSIILIVGVWYGLALAGIKTPWPHDHSLHTHSTHADKWHIHADFLVIVDNTPLDFGIPNYMTTPIQEPHRYAHLHDDNGTVLHLHAPHITFAEFLASLGYQLTADCLTTRAGLQYCTDSTNTLALFVNDSLLEVSQHATYEPADLDRILLFYGDLATDPFTEYIAAVGDEACLYSGSCPERGIAPPESCGLTCEL